MYVTHLPLLDWRASNNRWSISQLFERIAGHRTMVSRSSLFSSRGADLLRELRLFGGLRVLAVTQASRLCG